MGAALLDAQICHLLVKIPEIKRVFGQFFSVVWLQALDLVEAHPAVVLGVSVVKQAFGWGSHLDGHLFLDVVIIIPSTSSP